MASSCDEEEELNVDDDWGRMIAERYLNTKFNLQDLEKIIDCLSHGVDNFDDEILKKLFSYIMVFMILREPKDNTHCNLLHICITNRNLMYFLTKWHPKFLVRVIAHQAKENPWFVKHSLMCLPVTKRFSKIVIESKILKSCLKKFNSTDVIDPEVLQALLEVGIRYVHCKYFYIPNELEEFVSDAVAKIPDNCTDQACKVKGFLVALLCRGKNDEINQCLIDGANFNVFKSMRNDLCPKNCFNPNCPKEMEEEKAKYCTQCHYASYCCQKCQKKHWKNGGHKKDCKTIFEIGKNLRKIMEFEMERLEEILEDN